MTVAISAALSALNGLDVQGLSSVIAEARTLRAKAQLRRMAELVTVPVEVSANSEGEYDDHGGTYTYWTANYTFPALGGEGSVSCTDTALSDDPGELDDEDIEVLMRAFGSERGLSEDEVNAAMSEFANLSLAYASFISEDGDEASFTIRPSGEIVAAPSQSETFGYESVLHLASGRSIHVPAFPEPCSYVRVLDGKGVQVGYWVEDEWREDPSDVMGAIMGAAKDN